MKKTIILPTDFSDNARSAYTYAFGLFGFENVRYILLNTYIVTYTRMAALVSLRDKIAIISKQGLENELAYCKEQYPNQELDIKVYSEYGDVEIVLEDVIDNEKADYIIMGTKGATGIEKVLFGSNAASVIRNIKCPTIVVPHSAKFTNPTRIAFAADYEKLENLYSLKPLREIADRHHAKLLVFNVQPELKTQPPSSTIYKRNLHNTLKEIPHIFTTVNDDDVTEGIEDFIRDNNVQMLAMVARQHNFFERLFYRSITKQITLNLQKMPLLILHEK